MITDGQIHDAPAQATGDEPLDIGGLQIGEVVDGRITKLMPYGLFIELHFYYICCLVALWALSHFKLN